LILHHNAKFPLAIGTACAYQFFRKRRPVAKATRTFHLKQNFTSQSRLAQEQRSVPMLVLTRKSHEQIQIGDNITVTILRVKGGAIRVGIDAPRNVSVLRKELALKPANAVEAQLVPVVAEAVTDAAEVAPCRTSRSRMLSGGKTKGASNCAAENPARPRGAAPLGRYMARA
jgi:carbon storage regulator